MKSDEDMQQHEHHRAALSVALAAAAAVTTAPQGDASGVAANLGSESSGGALFDEFYDDWAAFDSAVARATELHHPIRKRSSLTFEVYNRTVSKGRHDRKSIAEYLSKTFKCTHGIKFRPRGKGRRERHKPRDTGCPFHVYATAVEFGATYRVRVRQQDRHNHPIGPDALKTMSGLLDADYDLGTESDMVAHHHHHQSDTHASAPPVAVAAATTPTAAVAGADLDLDAASSPLASKQSLGDHHHHAQTLADHHAHTLADHAQAHVLLKAQQQAIAHAHELLQAQAQQQAQAHVRAHAHARMQAEAQAMLQAQAHADMLVDAAVHESASLLESAIESSISADFAEASKEPSPPQPAVAVSTVVATESPVAATPVAVPAESVPSVAAAAASTPKFEPTTTLEMIRRKMAQFADERDWNQFHTPRNLVLALTGEVGELCEIFQWKGDNTAVADWTSEEKVHLGEEMSDVLLYLVRLADQCNVDLAAAVHDKMAKNARKYPAELVRGSSKKYNEYKRQRLDSVSGSAGDSVVSNASSASPPSMASNSSSRETALI